MSQAYFIYVEVRTVEKTSLTISQGENDFIFRLVSVSIELKMGMVELKANKNAIATEKEAIVWNSTTRSSLQSFSEV